jgi:hypothetical protein
MGALTEGLDYVVSTLAEAGIPTIVDVKKLRPGAVLIDPPSIVGISAGSTELSIPISVTSTPPGDPASISRMLDTVDTITALLPVLSGDPGIYSTGNQELPTYRINVRVTVRRTS